LASFVSNLEEGLVIVLNSNLMHVISLHISSKLIIYTERSMAQ
jgi:hypothetical protein